MAAHDVGSGSLDVANDKYLDRPQVGHGDTDLRADHLVGDARLNQGPYGLEAQSAHRDGAKLREADVAVPVDDQRVSSLCVAEELDLEPISGPDYVVDRHRDVLRGPESRRRTCKQIVAKRLQRRLERQIREADPEWQQEPLDREPLRRLEDGEPSHRDWRQTGQIERSGSRQSVRIAATHRVDQPVEIFLLSIGPLYEICLRRAWRRRRRRRRCRRCLRRAGPQSRHDPRRRFPRSRGQHTLLPFPFQRQDLDDQSVVGPETDLARRCPFALVPGRASPCAGFVRGLIVPLGAAGSCRSPSA